MTAGAEVSSGGQLITLREPASAAAEAYRTLRTNIQFSSLDRHIHTIMATAGDSSADGSLLLANLAVTMAQAEQRVLLVEADLRRPRLHEWFGAANDIGLTGAILEPESALPLQNTAVTGLQLLTAGQLPPRPADLLGSQRMAALIERLRGAADVVLFTTPPVVSYTDALVLATRVDATLLILQAGKARRDQAREARNKLEKVKANLLGAVLVGAREGTLGF
jgi:capsular exopolysaccharide synthesis family protein